MSEVPLYAEAWGGRRVSQVKKWAIFDQRRELRMKGDESRDTVLAPQEYLVQKKHPSPWDHHRSLGIGLLQGPTGWVFLVSEVPLYPPRVG